MQRIVYYVATSIDGAIARPDGSFDFFVDEGPHVTEYLDALKAFDAVLMGRHTYEVGTRLGVVDPYPWLATYVASSTLAESPHPNVTILRGGVADAVRSLRAREGRGVYLCGGGRLAAHLLANDLVDEIVLKLNPVIAGDGIRLVDAMPRPTPLKLLACHAHENGVVVLRYAVGSRTLS